MTDRPDDSGPGEEIPVLAEFEINPGRCTLADAVGLRIQRPNQGSEVFDRFPLNVELIAGDQVMEIQGDVDACVAFKRLIVQVFTQDCDLEGAPYEGYLTEEEFHRTTTTNRLAEAKAAMGYEVSTEGSAAAKSTGFGGIFGWRWQRSKAGETSDSGLETATSMDPRCLISHLANNRWMIGHAVHGDPRHHGGLLSRRYLPTPRRENDEGGDPPLSHVAPLRGCSHYSVIVEVRARKQDISIVAHGGLDRRFGEAWEGRNRQAILDILIHNQVAFQNERDGFQPSNGEIILARCSMTVFLDAQQDRQESLLVPGDFTLNAEPVRAVLAAKDATIANLARIAGLDPATDFRFADLSGVDWRGTDRSQFDLTGAIRGPGDVLRQWFEAFAPWADSGGVDQHGHWADVRIAGVVTRLRWIPPGRFVMGSPEDEPGHAPSEGPQTAVTIASGFWLMETPVTRTLWVAVMGSNLSKFFSSDLPMDRVSFEDVQRFLEAVNGQVPDFAMRLPSEAEWEYACRAGTTRPYVDADEADPQRIHFEGSQTIEVKGRPPNSWGLYQMLGNVWEWCADAWSGSHAGADPAGAPREPEAGVRGRVIRGGSWNDTARHVRAAYRGGVGPELRDDDLGFRCAGGRVQAGDGPEARREGRGAPGR